MTLKCPLGTTISVVLAQYGRTEANGTDRCSSFDQSTLVGDRQANQSCIWLQKLQHSLLQVVVEVCHNKRQCKFNTSPKTFQGDLCPGQSKYIEVAYQCRPYEFRSKVACENDVINLACHPGQRVAIFSASFGRTEYESLQCPQPHDVKEEMPRTVLKEQYQGVVEADEEDLVHQFDEGFDRADFRTEFSPSPNLEGPQSQPRDNVSRNFPTVSSSPPRARTNNDVDTRSNKFKSIGVGAKDSPLTPTVIQGMIMFDNNVADMTTSSTMSPINCTTVVYAFPEEDRVVVGYINEWINAYSFISKNQEKFYLYIILSITAGILIFLGLVIGRLLVSRHRAKRDAKFHTNNETLPNAFTDDISEIDADIDLTTPVPVPMQDPRIPETQLAERLHGDRYYAETRIPMSPTTIHQTPGHYQTNTTGVRVDLGNHMVGTDNLHTILRPENPRSLNTKNYYYG
ncbi:Protein FAM176C [Habropoda laboriosa]|uniref:Protein FAM176C n=1 Tax=Habropoda laboriosa TaxID=597456 RepID=A0A0L7R9Q0_9HYME|nr:Protein FAM176C [Habropoda laboriosa]